MITRAKRIVPLAIVCILITGCAVAEPAATPVAPTTIPPTSTPSSADPSLPALGDTWTRPADGMIMVYVPAGEFEMGSSDAEVDLALDWCNTYYSSCERAWFEVEQPVHTVELDGYWIDRTEVTNGQYQRCVEAGACDPPANIGSDTRSVYYGDSAYENYPVVNVNWHQADGYCTWVGGRLPTEAEWEYASRGPEGHRFPWGDEYDGTKLNACDVNCTYAWAEEAFDDGHADTAPVGSYPDGASWCGALDLAGNVWEWMADRFGDYSPERQVNPIGPSSGTRHTSRGDSADGTRSVSRCAARHGMGANRTYQYTGFRCVIPSEIVPAEIPLTQTGDDWPRASLDAVGMDASEIDRAVGLIEDSTYENVHAMMIVKEGQLVFEAYFSGYTWEYEGDQYRGDLVDFDQDTTHNLASVTKSFTSALVGIAIDQGLIESVDEPVCDFFSEYASLCDEGKEQITLEHLLTMTSGLEWNGMEVPLSEEHNDVVRLFFVPDPIEYILAKPIVSQPGTEWYYNGGNTNLLGEVIRQATGQRMDDFAAQHLFGPLGITDYEWDHITPDVIHASGNLKLRPRDMAKLGYVYLNGGVWNGQRVVSEAWIEASTQKQASTRGGEGYGYQWWLRTYRSEGGPVEAFYAAGWGGQRITVFPSLDMVIVFTGGNYVDYEPVDEIITEHILVAVR